MPQYFCPLCKQPVEKKLYEKITGIWREKEKVLSQLKSKEKALLAKEKQMKQLLEAEKKKLAAQVKKQKEELQKQKELLEKNFEKRIDAEISRAVSQEKARQKKAEKELKRKLKRQFEESAKQIIEKEKQKLKKDKAVLEKKERIQMDRYRKLNQQYVSLQQRSQKHLEKANNKIKLLEEQLKKNQTPQVLGLLEEGVFLAKLKQNFPHDEFSHPGKKGDIVHFVKDRGRRVGSIVYELKKVSSFSTKHIEQTFLAKQQRNADYGILITNAKRKQNDFGFFVAKGIIVIHPAGALALISILRSQIIRIASLKLTEEKRSEAVRAVLEYIQSPSFRNSLEHIMEETKSLYEELTKEVKQHIKAWEVRLSKYRRMYASAYNIGSKVNRTLADNIQVKKEIKNEELSPIYLPQKIT